MPRECDLAADTGLSADADFTGLKIQPSKFFAALHRPSAVKIDCVIGLGASYGLEGRT